MATETVLLPLSVASVSRRPRAPFWITLSRMSTEDPCLLLSLNFGVEDIDGPKE